MFKTTYGLQYVSIFTYVSENTTYTPAGLLDSRSSSGDIREGNWDFFFSADNLGFQQIKTIRDCRHSKSSNDMKNGLKHYINSESGTVEWQLC